MKTPLIILLLLAPFYHPVFAGDKSGCPASPPAAKPTTPTATAAQSSPTAGQTSAPAQSRSAAPQCPTRSRLPAHLFM